MRNFFSPLFRPLYGLSRRLFSDNSSATDTTILLSSGRSGSTWLGSMLQQVPTTRSVFEPFHHVHGLPELADRRFTYMAPGHNCLALARSFESIVSGATRIAWIEQFNHWATISYSRRVVKLVRGNLLYPWLRREFPDFRYILLLRHPAAVVLSQLKGKWNLSSARLNQQDILREYANLDRFDDFQWPDKGFLSNLIFWVIENEVALDCAHETGGLVLFYEDLCMQPIKELVKVQNYLKIEFPSKVFENLHEASWSSRRAITDLTPEQRVTRWQSMINEEQRKTLDQVLSRSSLAKHYGLDTLPQ